MKKIYYGICVLVAILLICGVQALAADLTLTVGGKVTIELISSSADFHDTLSLASPNASIARTGCKVEGTSFAGLKLLSEKISQHGCRVELDADPATPGIQPFPAGTVLSFNLCAQEDANPATCEHVWSSDKALNSDNFDHVKTTPIHATDYPGKIFQLAWEDLTNGGDQDFNDLIAVVRIDMDSDGDGLWDDWETYGIDTDGDGVVDLDLPALGADPRRKDIFIEIDFMDCTVTGSDCASGDNHSHRPKNAAITDVINAFANTPWVSNPDGTTGVTLHVDVNNAIAHQNTLPGMCFAGGPPNFDSIKADPANFGPNNPRRYAYHYVLFTHQQIATDTWSGCGEVHGNDFMVSLGGWNYRCVGGTNAGRPCPAARGGWDCPGSTCSALGDVDGDGTNDEDVGTVRQQAGTLMHELGHNLGLQHGGNDEFNYKPNYLSIMNYWFQFSGILPGGALDYSHQALASLDENNLNENNGIGDGTDNTRYFCPDGSARTGAGTGAIDWDCDNDNGVEASVSVNINGDCVDQNMNQRCDATEPDSMNTLAGYNDWANIKLAFQDSKDFEDGIHESTVDLIEQDYTTHVLILNHPPVADAGGNRSIECAGPSGAVVTLDGTASYDPDGDPLTFTWTGPFGSLTGPVVTPTLPLGTHVITLTVDDGNGAQGQASTSITVIVQDTTPPSLRVTLSPNLLWPPDHRMVMISADIYISDVCDPNPVVRLVSIVSNEPDNGLGDGDFPNDITGAETGTDDRVFSLRAERSGTGNGRIYTGTYAAADHSGNPSSLAVSVIVPHSK